VLKTVKAELPTKKHKKIIQKKLNLFIFWNFHNCVRFYGVGEKGRVYVDCTTHTASIHKSAYSLFRGPDAVRGSLSCELRGPGITLALV
jgi:hypothetical protein